MPGWHSVSDSFKTPQWTPPPIICSIPGSHTPARTWIEVCVFVRGWTCVPACHLYRMHDILIQIMFAWAGSNVLWSVTWAKDDMTAAWLDVLAVCAHAFTHLSCAGLLFLPFDRLALRKQSLLSRTKSLFASNRSYWSRQVIRGLHLICVYPLQSMKLITRSCCLFFAQLNRRRPNASLSLHKHSLWAPQPSSSFYSTRRADFAHFTCNIHAASENVWSSKLKKQNKLCQSVIVSCPYERE